MRREDKECCGTCKWHYCEEIIVGNKKLIAEKFMEWYCGNHTSELYQEYTSYEDCCEEWED